MTNRRHAPLYVGVTNDLVRRVHEHRNKLAKGFASKYNMTMLMYYEVADRAESAIAREKQLKGWLKRRKIDLIESVNPNWRDLAQDWYN
ncbi:MAG: GIY-YIG nuclease family protein [Chloroflexi bacterium]|nr:GIY-YIG nuclease family protein [Chloroflexota bacterium]